MIQTAELAFPKPGHAAGRVVLNGSAYSRNKRECWHAQGEACAYCSRPLESPHDGHYHHIDGRGMGGSKRDDRFGIVLCIDCHKLEDE